jgi:hypothetical protein
MKQRRSRELLLRDFENWLRLGTLTFEMAKALLVSASSKLITILTNTESSGEVGHALISVGSSTAK